MVASAESASAARIARLRAACASAGIDAFYARGTSNIAWLTAFDGVFDDEAAHALVVTPERAVLHTDSRYSLACEAAAQGTPIDVDASRRPHAEVAAEVVQAAAGDVVRAAAGDAHDAANASGEAASAGGCPEAAQRFVLGIEDDMTLAEYRRLERAFAAGEDAAADSAGTTSAALARAATPASAPSSPFWADLRETTNFVFGLRAAKDAGEIERMKAAQAITDAAFAHIVAFMRPGMTERAVQIELEDFMRRHGAEDLAFSSIVATGANGASPHAIPGEAVLEAGQCVVLDFGAKARGYCSDMTRTVFLGAPEGEMLRAWETLRAANEAVEAAICPGVTGAEMHQLAEDILAEGGFGGRMDHGLGHGVGMDIHEEPVLAPRNKELLVPGNVVTVEPGIYLPGKFGMRLEDFGVVTETGFEVFTKSTHEAVII
ncbi:MAG TPA: aminopeptidase P family protein [Candidatus Aveggerthella excrementigallinarum]|nr:aminopeptidase P family protein [Candidatus Aveggerthella excrementigallinarum]